MFQSYTNKLKYSLTNKYIVQLTGQTWYPWSHQYLKSLVIMENKNYASWVPDVRSFLWIFWVMYFPIEHLCLYNKISYSFPFQCKCYSKCNRISLIIVSTLFAGAVFYMYTYHGFWKFWCFGDKGELQNHLLKVSKCIIEQLRLWYFKLFRLIHCFLFKQEDIMSFFNATFPDFVQVMGE